MVGKPANEWRGFIPFEALPRLYNPTGGMVAMANNRIVDAGYTHPFQLKQPHRIRRIQRTLPDERLSLGDMAADSKGYGIAARARAGAIARRPTLTTPRPATRINAAVARFLEWTVTVTRKSSPAALFHVFHYRLITNLLPTTGRRIVRAYVEILNQCIAPLDAILADPASGWFTERARDRSSLYPYRKPAKNCACLRRQIEVALGNSFYRLTMLGTPSRNAPLQSISGHCHRAAMA